MPPLRPVLARIPKVAISGTRRLVPRAPRPTILMYHRVAEDPFDPWGLTVSPARFVDQLEWLTKNRTLLRLSEFAQLHGQDALPADAIALTFDDGYRCVATAAAPALERFGIPATIFLPAQLVERGGPFWWDELQVLVLGTDCASLSLGPESVALGDKQADDREWRPGAPPRTARQTAFNRLWALLRSLAPAELDQAMAELRLQADHDAVDAAPRPMTREEIRAIGGRTVEFGSHALTHPWLASLAPDEKAREIVDSMDECRALTGCAPAAFAYPYGNFDEESVRVVEQAGFACACATIPRFVTRKSRVFALPRMQVGDWTGKSLGRALNALR